MLHKRKSRRPLGDASLLSFVSSYEFFSSSCRLISNSASCGTTSQAISCITFSESCSTARRAIASIISGDNSCAEAGVDCAEGGAEYCGGARLLGFNLCSRSPQSHRQPLAHTLPSLAMCLWLSQVLKRLLPALRKRSHRLGCIFGSDR